MIARRSRNLLCRLLVGVLLCAQFLVAAHACPGASVMTAAVRHDAAPTNAAMACDEMMAGAASEQGPSPLCAEHCAQGQQSDQVPAVTLSGIVALASLYPLHLAGTPALHAAPPPRAAHAPVPAAPPHAVLHCCFRI